MRFRLDYPGQSLLADYDQQFVHGGVLVRGEPPPGVQLFSPAELEIRAGGTSVVLAAQVVQMFAGVGVALTFDAKDPRLLALVGAVGGGARGSAPAAAPVAPPGPAEPPAPARVAPRAAPPPPPPRRAASQPGMVGAPAATPAVTASSASAPAIPEPAAPAAPAGPVAPATLAGPSAPAAARRPPPPPSPGAAKAEKIHMALYGNRDERAAILRDTDRSLHLYVLRNPGLGADEITAMARNTQISPDVIKQIVDRREWVSRPEVAIALVRNPTVPVPLALRALEHVTVMDLRQLAKDTRTREPIAKAAKKKVLGG